ncbi:MAG: type II CRISPR-associated endonuclease Cas1 [Fibrobacter sp.]|nr:type II CRISPR-associated endonuclease Cas1 [Fibrobacter sp.]
MIGRILEIGTPGKFLKLYRGFCIIEEKGSEIGRIALDDLESVVLHSPDGLLSNQLLSEFATRNIPVILCNEKHMPIGIYWGLNGHYQGSKRINLQATLSLPKRKQIWQQIVKEKISNQATVLKAAKRDYRDLEYFASNVKSGDSDNREAMAAQMYWPRLLGTDFRRDPDADGINAFLNYGYAILRASVTRSIVAVGLHPAFSLFHHNAEDPTPLANDLMEPWRPIVDIAVYKLHLSEKRELTPSVKKELTKVLEWDMILNNQHSPLRLCIQRLTNSFIDFCEGITSNLLFAKLPSIDEIRDEWSEPCTD